MIPADIFITAIIPVVDDDLCVSVREDVTKSFVDCHSLKISTEIMNDNIKSGVQGRESENIFISSVADCSDTCLTSAFIVNINQYCTDS